MTKSGIVRGGLSDGKRPLTMRRIRRIRQGGERGRRNQRGSCVPGGKAQLGFCGRLIVCLCVCVYLYTVLFLLNHPSINIILSFFGNAHNECPPLSRRFEDKWNQRFSRYIPSDILEKVSNCFSSPVYIFQFTWMQSRGLPISRLFICLGVSCATRKMEKKNVFLIFF